jgi:hypothetical protein
MNALEPIETVQPFTWLAEFDTRGAVHEAIGRMVQINAKWGSAESAQGLIPTKSQAQGRVVKWLLAPNGPTPATFVAASA